MAKGMGCVSELYRDCLHVLRFVSSLFETWSSLPRGVTWQIKIILIHHGKEEGKSQSYRGRCRNKCFSVYIYWASFETCGRSNKKTISIVKFQKNKKALKAIKNLDKRPRDASPVSVLLIPTFRIAKNSRWSGNLGSIKCVVRQLDSPEAKSIILRARGSCMQVINNRSAWYPPWSHLQSYQLRLLGMLPYR